jgi:hypothetical protein
MRLLKIGWTVVAASAFALSSGMATNTYGYDAEPGGMEFASAAAGSTFEHSSLLAEAGTTSRFGYADTRRDVARTSAHYYTPRPFANATLPPRSTSVVLKPTAATARFSDADEPPSAWLMGGVILFLIGYQLRRKHRLLRPYRFHELR